MLVTSPRVAPGLLTAPAWRACTEADRVLSLAPDDATARSLREAGVVVESAPAGDPLAAVLAAAASTGDLVCLAPPGRSEWARELAGQLLAGRGDDLFVEVLHGS